MTGTGRSRALAELIEILSPERVDENLFRGKGSSGDGAEGTFGGHFLGQASAAALATVGDDRNLHSLHAYFLRAGRPGVPIDYAVERLRDGRSFSTRRVSARQDGKTAFEMIASITVGAEGAPIEAAPPADLERLPEPESLPRYHELMATHDPVPLPAEWALREHGVDVRVVDAPWAPGGPSAAHGIRMWMRAHGPVGPDPKLHAAMLAYQSDESISDNVLVPFGVTWGTPGVFLVSLDHALWLHRPIDMAEWHFVEQWPVSAAHARGVSTGQVWTRDGRLVATFTQEGLMRLPEHGGPA